jgi:uncharacterized protein YjbI with pentapeptide repeats
MDSDLKRANLMDADLSGANLSGANLSGANLSGADLMDSDLKRADLSGASLMDSDLSGANLSGANLSGANLMGANLMDADLSGANLRRADLMGANLSNNKINENTTGYTLACPDEGEFIAFKKCQRKIVKLKVLADALRSSATSAKCRCSKALVIEIDGGLTEIASDHDSNFVYRVGEVVEVTNFDTDRWNECSTGIHFFTSRLMAENYNS